MNIRLWKQSDDRFEQYLMAKHPNCRGTFDFDERRAYMLYHRGDRLGALPSPKMEAGE
ncbi:MAG: hypothetical protein ABEL76_13685 [Bradymonadaceae bacterium]